MQKVEFRAAQLHFDKLLERVQRGEQFEITVRGRPIAYLKRPDKPGERAGRTSNLVASLQRSPLRQSGSEVRRPRGGLRKVRL